MALKVKGTTLLETLFSIVIIALISFVGLTVIQQINERHHSSKSKAQFLGNSIEFTPGMKSLKVGEYTVLFTIEPLNHVDLVTTSIINENREELFKKVQIKLK